MTGAPAPADAAEPTTGLALAGSAAAAAARRARAEIKRELAFSGESLRRVVAACGTAEGAAVRRMPVVELLAAMPGVGPARAEELAALAGIAPGRRLAGLGQVQVATLARIIDERAARRAARRGPCQ